MAPMMKKAVAKSMKKNKVAWRRTETFLRRIATTERTIQEVESTRPW